MESTVSVGRFVVYLEAEIFSSNLADASVEFSIYISRQHESDKDKWSLRSCSRSSGISGNKDALGIGITLLGNASRVHGPMGKQSRSNLSPWPPHCLLSIKCMHMIIQCGVLGAEVAQDPSSRQNDPHLLCLTPRNYHQAHPVPHLFRY